jgi:predicted KAP-like P-loop ATPase
MPQPSVGLLYSDHPIRAFDEDELGIREFVERLTRPLLHWPTRESLVIGLYAPWGSGKTSILNLLEVVFENAEFRNRAIVTRFNPWLYSDSETLLRAFFNTLNHATHTTPLLTATRKKSLKTALEAISRFAVPVFAPATQILAGGVDLLTPGSSALMHALTAALSEGEGEFDANKRKAAAALASLGTRSRPARLIVLIDDLDRAESREVLAMLKVVRLIADLPNVTYVLATDYYRITKLISRSGEGLSGSDYLEKIIQIGIQLPPISSAKVRQLLLAGVDSILREAAGESEFVSIEAILEERRVDLSDVILWRVRNLRHRARLLNSFRFLLLSGKTPLEIDPVDALLVAFLQTFYPLFIERIRCNKTFLTRDYSLSGIISQLGRKNKDRQQLRKASLRNLLQLDDFSDAKEPALGTGDVHDSEQEQEEIDLTTQPKLPDAIMQERTKLRAILLLLFPYVEIGETPSDVQRLRWRRENRITSAERFDRYFAYTVPEDSVSDATVNAWIKGVRPLLSKAPSLSDTSEWHRYVNVIFTPLSEIVGPKRTDFVEKVIDRIPELSKAEFPVFALVFAYAGLAEIVSDSEAAEVIRQLLLTFWKDMASGHYSVDSVGREEVEPVQWSLHNAFAVLLSGVKDPFDAVHAAGQHVNTWRRRLSQSEEEFNSGALPDALQSVLDVGLSRVDAAVKSKRDVFEDYGIHAGGPLWRWRDLLRHTHASYTPIRLYLKWLIDTKSQHVPAVLGLFAGWSGDSASLDMVNYADVRRGAEEIIGWCTLLRAVANYRKQSHPVDASCEHLIGEFADMLHLEAARRRQAANVTD